jgi:hypothetical protein
MSRSCANVRGPDAGDDRTGQILYGDEIVALLQGVPVDAGAEPVPLCRRQAHAGALYTKTRAGELEALTAEDVDLARLTIDVEPNLLELLEWLAKNPQGKGGRLFHMPPPEDRAETSRSGGASGEDARRKRAQKTRVDEASGPHDAVWEGGVTRRSVTWRCAATRRRPSNGGRATPRSR